MLQHLSKKKIQIIVPNPEKYETAVEYINTFDLDVCKNYFDGTRFEVGTYEGILNSTAVYTPESDDLSNYDYILMSNRLRKYSDRGFKIMIDINILHKFSTEYIENVQQAEFAAKCNDFTYEPSDEFAYKCTYEPHVTTKLQVVLDGLTAKARRKAAREARYVKNKFGDESDKIDK